MIGGVAVHRRKGKGRFCESGRRNFKKGWRGGGMINRSHSLCYSILFGAGSSTNVLVNNKVVKD